MMASHSVASQCQLPGTGTPTTAPSWPAICGHRLATRVRMP